MSTGIETYGVPPKPDPRKPDTSVEDVRNWQRYVPYLVEKAVSGQDGLTAAEQSALPSAFNLESFDPSSLAPPGGPLASLMQQLGLGRSGGLSAAESAKQAEYSALVRWYRTGAHLAPYEGYRKNVTDSSAASRQAAQGMYDRAYGNIAAGYGAADQMIGTGYNAVFDYLNRNQPNAYAGFQPSAMLNQTPMQNYFDAYGVSSEPVAAQVAAQNASAQQGVGGFATLVDILNRASQQAGQSRTAELELARNLGMQNLAGQRSAYESQATSALQQALAQIAQDEQNRLFEIAKAEAAVRAEGGGPLAEFEVAKATAELSGTACDRHGHWRAQG
jgi:hypothetical protein